MAVNICQQTQASVKMRLKLTHCMRPGWESVLCKRNAMTHSKKNEKMQDNLNYWCLSVHNVCIEKDVSFTETCAATRHQREPLAWCHQPHLVVFLLVCGRLYTDEFDADDVVAVAVVTWVSSASSLLLLSSVGCSASVWAPMKWLYMVTAYAYLIFMPTTLLLASVNSVNSNHPDCWLTYSCLGG